VLDLRMPGMSGLDLLHWLSERGYQLPVVVLTATADAGDRERLLARGVTAVLSKPSRAADILEAVRRALDLNGE
jgi:CheY-like chemotaxis protein